MKSLDKLEVVIVNYNSANLTIRCIKTVISAEIVPHKNIIIVDNNSPDDSFARLAGEFPDLTLVAAPSNRGFGAGVNLGARLSRSEYILVLNPDTYFEFDSVASVIGLMDRSMDIAIGGLDLVNPDRSRQFSARRFYSLVDVLARRMTNRNGPMKQRVDKHLMVAAWANGEAFDAEWVLGAGFVIRRSVFEAMGGMDEKYFLYMEDVDICARAWSEGYRVVCVPGAELVHDHQRSSAGSPLSFTGRKHIASLLRFALKFRLPIFRPPGILGVIN